MNQYKVVKSEHSSCTYYVYKKVLWFFWVEEGWMYTYPEDGSIEKQARSWLYSKKPVKQEEVFFEA
jgi:hypothetical protein